ncbi:hypothetical protein M378DRAFT_174113, partial [Amanita muscaria Koide BX008]
PLSGQILTRELRRAKITQPHRTPSIIGSFLLQHKATGNVKANRALSEVLVSRIDSPSNVLIYTTSALPHKSMMSESIKPGLSFQPPSPQALGAIYII